MMNQNKKIAGVILIAFLLPMLACNVPKSLLLPFGQSKSAMRLVESNFDATVVPDNYDSQYSCTINTGSYYDHYVGYRPSQFTTVELSEIESTC